MDNESYNIVEIGSTNTKAYTYCCGRLIKYHFHNIEFKKNYNLFNCIQHSDILELSDFIKSSFSEPSQTRIYGTSIFRQLTEEQLSEFLAILHSNVPFLSFQVVSPEMENELTAFGAINGFSSQENICVFIGGGGSTEISIYNNKHLLETSNTPFGVVDVMKKFPDLSNDSTAISIDEVGDYIRQKQILLPANKARYLILAGGDFLLRYNNAGYPTRKNDLFNSTNHPYIIDYNSNRHYEDIYYNSISLSELRKTTPLTPKWWDGTRAMCAFTDVVAKHVGAEFIFPTNISMVYGIVAKLEQDSSAC